MKALLILLLTMTLFGCGQNQTEYAWDSLPEAAREALLAEYQGRCLSRLAAAEFNALNSQFLTHFSAISAGSSYSHRKRGDGIARINTTITIMESNGDEIYALVERETAGAGDNRYIVHFTREHSESLLLEKILQGMCDGTYNEGKREAQKGISNADVFSFSSVVDANRDDATEYETTNYTLDLGLPLFFSHYLTITTAYEREDIMDEWEVDWQEEYRAFSTNGERFIERNEVLGLELRSFASDLFSQPRTVNGSIISEDNIAQLLPFL